jgi:hypothetical protein
MPVYNERYDRLIDFDTDGEEWARNLPTAYRNGAVYVYAEEVPEPAGSTSRAYRPARNPDLLGSLLLFLFFASSPGCWAKFIAAPTTSWCLCQRSWSEGRCKTCAARS